VLTWHRHLHPPSFWTSSAASVARSRSPARFCGVGPALPPSRASPFLVVAIVAALVVLFVVVVLVFVVVVLVFVVAVVVFVAVVVVFVAVMVVFVVVAVVSFVAVVVAFDLVLVLAGRRRACSLSLCLVLSSCACYSRPHCCLWFKSS
jgi:hypothetical protein